MRARDLLKDVLTEMHSRLGRTLMLVAAVALATGATLASLSIATNSSRQIDASIASSTTRQITVNASAIGAANPERFRGKESRFYPEGAVDALAGLPGVQAVGIYSGLDPRSSSRFADAGAETVRVIAASSGYIDAARAHLIGNSELLDSSLPLAFLGIQAAQALHIPVDIDVSGSSVLIEDQPFSVAGYVEGGTLDNVIILPYDYTFSFGNRSDLRSEILVYTRPGAGPRVSEVAALSANPTHPEWLSASAVIARSDVRDAVAGQLATQIAWIGGFLLILTTLLIANAMIVSVTARTSEIGIRRALGASRGNIAATFLLEGLATGTLGGILGSTLAAWATLLVAVLQDWSVHFSPALLALGPALGAVVGVLATAYPALRAAQTEPATAIRAD